MVQKAGVEIELVERMRRRVEVEAELERGLERMRRKAGGRAMAEGVGRWAVEARCDETGWTGATGVLVLSAGKGGLMREGDETRELGKLPGRAEGVETCGEDEEPADAAAGVANGVERAVAGACVARELGGGSVLEKWPD
jgi:hypothetical protein